MAFFAKFKIFLPCGWIPQFNTGKQLRENTAIRRFYSLNYSYIKITLELNSFIWCMVDGKWILEDGLILNYTPSVLFIEI
jgi:hypothetical protein